MRTTTSFLRVLSLLCLLVLLGTVQSAWADMRSIDNSSPQEVMDAMANKAVRGVANVTTGWLELPKQIYQTYSEEGAAKGIFVGPIKGIGMALIRTFAGVSETMLFFVAYPGFYDPIVEPVYVWKKE